MFAVGATQGDAPAAYPAQSVSPQLLKGTRATGLNRDPILNSPLALYKRSDLYAERFANARSGSASRRAAVPRDQVRPTDRLTA